MTSSWGARAAAGPGLVLATLVVSGFLACSLASPLAAQAGLDKGAVKRDMSALDVAVARLHDGWRHATLAVGPDADPEVVVESIVRMIHDPIKLVGLGTPGALEREENLTLKAAVARAEERVRAASGAMRQGSADVTAVRAATQRALDDYLVVLGPWLATRPSPSPGAVRP